MSQVINVKPMPLITDIVTLKSISCIETMNKNRSQQVLQHTRWKHNDRWTRHLKSKLICIMKWVLFNFHPTFLPHASYSQTTHHTISLHITCSISPIYHATHPASSPSPYFTTRLHQKSHSITPLTSLHYLFHFTTPSPPRSSRPLSEVP